MNAKLFSILTLLAAFVGLARAATINALDAPAFPRGGNWSNPTHWDLGRAPITGDDVVFNGGQLRTTYDLGAGVLLRSLTFITRFDALDGGPIRLQSGGNVTLLANNLWGSFLPGVALNGPATLEVLNSPVNGDEMWLEGAITGTGPLTLRNTGRHDTLELRAASSYTGATTIDGTARVLITVTDGIPSTSALTVNAGASVGFAQPNTVASLSGAGNMEITGRFTVGGGNTSTAYAGVIAGSSGFTKIGTGTLTLSGAHTYTGTTLVSAGTLTVNGSLHASSTVTVAAGATLNGTGTINGNVLFVAGSTIAGVTINGSITQLNPPAITSATSIMPITYGDALPAYTITATNTANTPVSYSISGGSLPAGVTLNTSTGAISGTPTVAGTFNATISATNAAGTGSLGLTLTIHTIPLTVTGLGAGHKVYDGTTAATVTGTGTLVGVVGGDTVTLTGTATGTFATATVGTGKTVTIGGLSLGGGSAGNYSLTFPTATAEITAKALTVAGLSASNKPFDGTTTATITGTGSLVGVVGGDTVTLLGTPVGTFATATVGAGKTVSVTGLSLGGGLASNYQLSSTTTTADITAATVMPVITASNKVYDGAPGATIATRALTGVIGTDDVTLTGGTATFANALVETGKTATATGLALSGAAAGNYQLSTTTATATATITAATVTPVVTVNNKAYDSTTAATIATRTLTGVMGSDDVTLTGGVGTFASGAVGSGKTVTITGLALGGAAAANYQLASTTTTATAAITGAVLTPVVKVSDKAYNGTTSGTIASRALTGVIGGDDVILVGGTATFATANVGTGIAVSVTDLALGGAAADSYVLATTSVSTTAGITRATASLSFANVNHVYDGQPKSASVVVLPGGLITTLSYLGLSGPPSAAGRYGLVATVNDANYTGYLTGELVIAKAPAMVTLAGLDQNFDGTPRTVTVTTTPAALPVTVSYDGAATAPTSSGTYAVVATVASPNYTGSASGTLTILGTGPIITQQPAGRTAAAGTDVSFSVAATGDGPLRYQWRLDGVPVVGATAATLSLTDVRSAQAGAYTVAITDDRGSVTSATAMLAVQAGHYAGAYFGTLGSNQGSWAMVIRADGTGTLLLYIFNGNGGYLATIVVNGDGEFEGFATRLPQGVVLPGSIDGRAVAAAPGDPAIAGRIVEGVVTGSTGALGFSLQGQAGAGGPVLAAAYSASSTGSSPISINIVVGASGQAFVLVSSSGGVTSGTGTVSGGTLTATLGDGATLGAAIAPDGAVSGTLLRGGVTTSFTGVADGTGQVARLVNVATRGVSGAGDNVMIAGFAIGGTEPKQVLVRAVGPALGGFGVSGVLMQPTLELFQGAARLAQNQGWGTAANAGEIAAAAAASGAFALTAGSADSVLLVTLPPGSYTAIARGANNTTGIALAEVYEVGAGAGSRLVNLATRGAVGAGDNVMIAGLVVSGAAPKRLLVRAIGPSLGSFGVAGALADAQLRIMQGATEVAANDNWSNDPAVAATADQVGAFALPANSRDAALLVTLAPGAYTVIVSGAGSATGVALVEVYEAP